MKETIAANIIRYRKSLRLSQEQLAEIVGMTRQSINNYENAKTLPDSKTLSAIARALGVTLDDLLRPKLHLVLCFIAGLIAFPFALLAFTTLILWRIIRAFVKRLHQHQ
ncbi:MAG: helix-turn-helix transcriptional regulator [Coleofasciculus sp. C2-GNP5-27]